MSQALDISLIFSSALSKCITFPVWQVNTSILKRLQGMKWHSSIYEVKKLQDIKWHSLIRKSKPNVTVEGNTCFPPRVEGDACFPVYYRTYSRKGDLKLGISSLYSNCLHETFSCTLLSFLSFFQVEKINFWDALPDKLRRKNGLDPEKSFEARYENFLFYLFGNPYWRPDKLTKPICFVVDNANWLIRLALLSTPLVPALCMGSKKLRQAI